MTDHIDADIASVVGVFDKEVPDARGGLPQDLFYLVSRLTPLVNVDLLVVNEVNEKLLVWRDDEFYGPGWHIPGGIIRFKETAADRIQAVACNELSATVDHEPVPMSVHEIMAPHRDIRGHFISLLYKCVLKSDLDESQGYNGGSIENGMWAWFKKCPSELIQQHRIYESCFN